MKDARGDLRDVSSDVDVTRGDGLLVVADVPPGAIDELFEDNNVAVASLPAGADLETVSANEWMVRNAPYTSGDLTLSAAEANGEVAAILDCPEESAVFTMERATWLHGRSITFVRLTFRPGHVLQTNL